MRYIKMCLTIIAAVWGLVVVIDASINGKLFASENTYLIEVDRLTREVSAGLARISNVSAASDHQIRHLEDAIQDKLGELRSAKNEYDLVACQKEYFGLRANVLSLHAQKADTNEQELTKLVVNLDQLEEAQRNSRAFGLGEAIKVDDLQAQRAIADVLTGQQNLLKMVSRVSPATDIGNAADALQIRINVANKFFGNDRNVNFEQQKHYAVDALLLVREVKNLLRQAHDDLLQKLYYVDARHTVQQLSDLKIAVLGDTIKGPNGVLGSTKVDDQVTAMRFVDGTNRQVGPTGGHHPGLQAEITFGR